MKRTIFLPYNPRLKALSRELRNNSTLSEVLLWQQIKNRQIRKMKFLRQRPVDNFVVDFYCPELMLAIEIDGRTHDFKVGADKVRQEKLESLGIRFLRFLDTDIRVNMEGVLKVIERWIDNTPLPPLKGGRCLTVSTKERCLPPRP